MQRLLNASYQDRRRAEREIAQLSAHLPAAGLNRIDMLLSASAAPEQGLQYFARLAEQYPAAFERLTRSDATVRCLVAVFTHSTFLSEEILEHPEWATHLFEAGDLDRVLTVEEFRQRLDSAMAPGVPGPLELARFRRRQILRILIRDVL